MTLRRRLIPYLFLAPAWNPSLEGLGLPHDLDMPALTTFVG